MISAWWLAVEAGAFTALILYLQRVSYRCGIWDGAFNHFLPIVQAEMVFYDERRAKLIFEADDAYANPGGSDAAEAAL